MFPARHRAKTQAFKPGLTPRYSATCGPNPWAVTFEPRTLSSRQGQESARVVQNFFVGARADTWPILADGAPARSSPVNPNQTNAACRNRSRKYSFQLSGNSFTPNARRTVRFSASPYRFAT
jgi:hypothetical protein